MIIQTHLKVTLYVKWLSCFLSFQGSLIQCSMNTSKYTKNAILLQTGLSVSSRRRVLLSGPLMVSNQHADASCRITGVASLSTSLFFLSSKPDYSWEIKEQIFKWCHTHIAQSFLFLVFFRFPCSQLQTFQIQKTHASPQITEQSLKLLTYCYIHAMEPDVYFTSDKVCD
jgi:hypothetical protein